MYDAKLAFTGVDTVATHHTATHTVATSDLVDSLILDASGVNAPTSKTNSDLHGFLQDSYPEDPEYPDDHLSPPSENLNNPSQYIREAAAATVAGAAVTQKCPYTEPVPVSAHELTAGHNMETSQQEHSTAEVEDAHAASGKNGELGASGEIGSGPISPLEPFRMCLPGALGVMGPVDLNTLGDIPRSDTSAPQPVFSEAIQAPVATVTSSRAQEKEASLAQQHVRYAEVCAWNV